MQKGRSARGVKALKRLPANARALIVAKIEQYAGDPASLAANVKMLHKAKKGETAVLRLRVGDWRVIFTLAGEAMLVTRVAARGDAYD